MLTAAEWLSENSERQELALQNIPLAMELYAKYRETELSRPPKDVVEAIAAEGKKRTECHNLNQAEAGYNAKWFRRGGEYGYSLASGEAVAFLDSIRSYERESLEPIAFDERTTEELYELFKKERNG